MLLGSVEMASIFVSLCANLAECVRSIGTLCIWLSVLGLLGLTV